MKTLLAVLILSLPAWSSCTSLGSGRWSCPDQGSATTNGNDLFDLLNSGTVACGDTIILSAGVEYHADSRDGFYMKPQTGCGGKKTQIVSNRLSEIPLNQKKNLKNYRALMPWLSTNTTPLFRFCANSWGTTGAKCANNWAVRGVYMSNDTASLGGASNVNVLFGDTGVYIGDEADNANYGVPRDIEVDRLLMENREAVVYGDPTPDNTDGNAWITNLSVGLNVIGNNWYMHDSYTKLIGYSRSGYSWLGSITGTAANPARLHSTNGTNLTTRLGISTGNYIRLVVRGGTGNWAGANGLVAAVGRADGDLDIHRHYTDRPPSGPGAAIDGSGFGASAGTIEVIQTTRDLQMNFLIGWGAGFRFIDNYFSSFNTTIFTGGGTPALLDPATIQSGSTVTTLNLDHARGLEIGDLVAIDVPDGSSYSQYCPIGSGYGCEVTSPYDGRLLRKGLVTAINGTTVTVRPWGISGIDITPKVGGRAWWKSLEAIGMEVRGNEIDYGYGTPHDLGGKGPMEFKQMRRGMVDGNVVGGYLDDANGAVRSLAVVGDFFVLSADQNGQNPNHRVEDFRISNNLAMGTDSGGVEEACVDSNLHFSEYYQSGNLGRGNVVFEHNLRAGCQFTVGGNVGITVVGLRGGSGYRHETKTHTTATTAQGTNYLLYQGDCRPFYTLPWDNPSHPEYFQSLGAVIRDNILPHGLTTATVNPGATSDATLAMCFPGYASEFTNNAIQVTNAGNPANQAALDAVLPNNTLVTDMTNFYDGTCKYDSWRNCRLNPSNPLRGTASDGGDPGADVDQIDDRLHRWSERAGLIESDMPSFQQMRLRRGNWTIGSTTAVVRFQIYASSPSACTVELFTNRNRATAHADASSAQACNRTSSAVSGNTVAYTFGGASALTANTEYFYKITDGARIMVGEFRTQPAGSGAAVSTYRYSSARTGNLCTDAAMTTSCSAISSAATHSVSVPQGAIRYYQAAGGAVIPVVAR